MTCYLQNYRPTERIPWVISTTSMPQGSPGTKHKWH
jgi:hypothetical protein